MADTEDIVFRSCDDYEYAISDGCVTILRYLGDAHELTIPSELDGNRVTTIGYSAFLGCSSTSIAIPQGVTTIDAHAFWYCSSLTSITIPQGVTTIGDVAFMDCSLLSSVTIPSSVVDIGANPFCGCSSMTDIYVSPDNSAFVVMNGALIDKRKKELICLPNAFDAGSYSIPAGVTSIGDQAFFDCSSLTSIDIPQGVTSIGRWAFIKCPGLRKVRMLGDIEDFDFAGVFGYPDLLRIHFTFPRDSKMKRLYRKKFGFRRLRLFR